MLEVTANGHDQRFDELTSNTLVSEARTMLMIESTINIPVSAGYAFDASLDDELHAPFILTERIEGAPLFQYWFNEDGHPKPLIEKVRARGLQSAA